MEDALSSTQRGPRPVVSSAPTSVAETFSTVDSPQAGSTGQVTQASYRSQHDQGTTNEELDHKNKNANERPKYSDRDVNAKRQESPEDNIRAENSLSPHTSIDLDQPDLDQPYLDKPELDQPDLDQHDSQTVLLNVHLEGHEDPSKLLLSVYVSPPEEETLALQSPQCSSIGKPLRRDWYLAKERTYPSLSDQSYRSNKQLSPEATSDCLKLSNSSFELLFNRPVGEEFRIRTRSAADGGRRLDVAMLSTYRAWHCALTERGDEARRILSGVLILYPSEPYIRLAVLKVQSLMALLEGNLDGQRQLVKSVLDLMQLPLAPGMAGQAGWVFLHHALLLTSGADRNWWLDSARYYFHRDDGSQAEAAYGRDVAAAVAMGKSTARHATRRTDTPFSKFYRDLVLQPVVSHALDPNFTIFSDP